MRALPLRLVLVALVLGLPSLSWARGAGEDAWVLDGASSAKRLALAPRAVLDPEEGTILHLAEEHLHCRTQAGVLRWRVPLALPPAALQRVERVGDLYVVVPAHRPWMRALDVQTGMTRWQVDLDGWTHAWLDGGHALTVTRGPDNRVVVREQLRHIRHPQGTRTVAEGPPTLRCLDLRTGTTRWTRTLGSRAWRHVLRHARPHAVVTEGHHVQRLDPVTGMPRGPLTPTHGVWLGATGHLRIVGTVARRLQRWDAGGTAPRWSVPIPQGARIASVAWERIVLQTDTGLHLIARADGARQGHMPIAPDPADEVRIRQTRHHVLRHACERYPEEGGGPRCTVTAWRVGHTTPAWTLRDHALLDEGDDRVLLAAPAARARHWDGRTAAPRHVACLDVATAAPRWRWRAPPPTGSGFADDLGLTGTLLGTRAWIRQDWTVLD